MAVKERQQFGLPMPDDFTPWAGGEEGPLHSMTLVHVWFRLGRSSVKPKAVHVWHWRHTGSTGDIIGYRAKDPS